MVFELDEAHTDGARSHADGARSHTDGTRSAFDRLESTQFTFERLKIIATLM